MIEIVKFCKLMSRSLYGAYIPSSHGRAGRHREPARKISRTDSGEMTTMLNDIPILIHPNPMPQP